MSSSNLYKLYQGNILRKNKYQIIFACQKVKGKNGYRYILDNITFSLQKFSNFLKLHVNLLPNANP